MQGVMMCLQQKLVPFIDGSRSTSCNDVKSFAIGVHPQCYVEYGLCDLPPSDWAVIADVVLPSLFEGPDVLKAIVSTAKACGWKYLSLDA